MIINEFINHLITLIGSAPDISPIKSEVADWANKLLATLFGLFGIAAGWWAVSNLFSIAKHRNDPVQRADHITAMQWLLGAFIATLLIITILNIATKALVLPQIGS